MRLQTYPNVIRLLPFLIFTIFLGSCVPEPVDPDYSGSWNCQETTSNPAATATFTVHLKKSGTNYQMENIYNLGFNVQANLVFTSSSISIPQQQLAGFGISGSGQANGENSISLSYTADDGSGQGADNCTAQLTRK